ncbi:MAG: AAA family ATPase [Nitrospirae bacterium]|nr:AAA family ATPase [Nitrospirota bacterium]
MIIEIGTLLKLLTDKSDPTILTPFLRAISRGETKQEKILRQLMSSFVLAVEASWKLENNPIRNQWGDYEQLGINISELQKSYDVLDSVKRSFVYDLLCAVIDGIRAKDPTVTDSSASEYARVLCHEWAVIAEAKYLGLDQDPDSTTLWSLYGRSELFAEFNWADSNLYIRTLSRHDQHTYVEQLASMKSTSKEHNEKLQGEIAKLLTRALSRNPGNVYPNKPILIIGSKGGGKTSICRMFAAFMAQSIPNDYPLIVNLLDLKYLKGDDSWKTALGKIPHIIEPSINLEIGEDLGNKKVVIFMDGLEYLKYNDIPELYTAIRSLLKKNNNVRVVITTSNTELLNSVGINKQHHHIISLLPNANEVKINNTLANDDISGSIQPISVYFDLDEFSEDEIVKILGLFSDINRSFGGDGLVIEQTETFEYDLSRVPSEVLS